VTTVPAEPLVGEAESVGVTRNDVSAWFDDPSVPVNV